MTYEPLTGESMKKKEAKPKSSPPAGILKKPLPSTPQQSYITRATVQKVLERQRAQVGTLNLCMLLGSVRLHHLYLSSQSITTATARSRLQK